MSSALAETWNLFDRSIEWARFRAVAGLIPNASVLVDLGSGRGEFLRAMEGRLREGIGFDPNTDDERLSERLVLRRLPSDGTLDLPSNRVDVITMLAVLEHIPLDLVDRIMTEIHRTLKPGGILLLTTPAPRAQRLLEFLAFRLRIISHKDISDHKRYYGEKDLRLLCAPFSTFRYDTFLMGLNQRVVASK